MWMAAVANDAVKKCTHFLELDVVSVIEVRNSNIVSLHQRVDINRLGPERVQRRRRAGG